MIMKGHEYLALEILSTSLKLAGHHVELIFDPSLFDDAFISSAFLMKKFNADRAIIRKAVNYAPDYVLFTLYSNDVTWAQKRAKELKQATGAKVIVGGPHATAVPELVAEYPYFDYVMMGDGEETLPQLIESINNNRSPKTVRGTYYREDGKIIGTENHHLTQNLDIFPPDKEQFYCAAPWATKEYNLLVSRGCGYKCTYCYNNTKYALWDRQGQYLRYRSIDSVISELSAMQERNKYTLVNIWDDNLIMNRNYAHDFFDEYKKKIHIPFKIFVHPLHIDNGIAQLLSEAGCWGVEIGVQAVDECGRRLCGRKESDGDIKRAVEILKNSGLKVILDFMVGLPFQTYRDIYSMCEFVAKIKPDQSRIFLTRYFPKTELTQIAYNEGLISDYDLNEINNGTSRDSYIYNKKLNKQIDRVRSLLIVAHYFPLEFIKFMKKIRIEIWLPRFNSFFQMVMTARGFFQPYNDIARSFLKKYRYYLLGDGRKWLK
ncbi:MAG: B12-binding domain-containing radical SAM protein [Lachnospiraceae bacterium]|nr:B12-binding domain-containing radical SAM protein [Lachnospiraceae bacterium]